MTLAFHIANRRVYASDGIYSEPLSDGQVERQLDLLQELGLKRQFHQLYEAHMANGGVPRCLAVGDVEALVGLVEVERGASQSLPGYDECALASASVEPSAAGA